MCDREKGDIAEKVISWENSRRDSKESITG